MISMEAAIRKYTSDEERCQYEWRKSYEDYIKSDKWEFRKKKFLAITQFFRNLQNFLIEGEDEIRWDELGWKIFFQSIDWKKVHCEKCLKRGNIEIHHRHYRNLGNEQDCDLVALCGFCHFALHKVVKATGCDIEIVTETFMKRSNISELEKK